MNKQALFEHIKTTHPEHGDEIVENIHKVMGSFLAYCIPELGLFAFKKEAVIAFFTQDDVFSLALNKVKGKGVLYGQDHVKLRQAFLNKLSKKARLALLQPKLSHKGVLTHCLAINGLREKPFSLVDIQDIGMSHSLYRIDLEVSGKLRSFVVKEEAVQHQSFYSHLLQNLGWPSYHSVHISDDQHHWEISDYISPNSVQDLLVDKDCQDREKIETALAQHAALGDVLGRGDRHLENYMLRDGQVLPVDVSYLFWEDNEAWTGRYIKGGLYEINVLLHYADDLELLTSKINNFFEVYLETLQFLSERKATIIDSVEEFFWKKEPETQRKEAFFISRLDNLKEFMAQKEALYRGQFEACLTWYPKKIKLEKLLQHAPELLDDYPMLKMYALANRGRYACFYLCEDEGLLAKVDELFSQSGLR